MSYSFPTDRERQLILSKKKHLRSIMLYNQQQAANKKRIKTEEKEQSHHQSLIEEETIRDGMRREREQWQRRRNNERKDLQMSYDQQMDYVKQKKNEEKRMDRQFFVRQIVQMQFEEERRLQQMSRMFKAGPIEYRPSTKQSKLSRRSRIKTQIGEDALNPEHRLKTSKLQHPFLQGGRRLARPVTEGAKVPNLNQVNEVAKSRACSLPFIDNTADSLDRLTVQCALRRPLQHSQFRQY